MKRSSLPLRRSAWPRTQAFLLSSKLPLALGLLAAGVIVGFLLPLIAVPVPRRAAATPRPTRPTEPARSAAPALPNAPSTPAPTGTVPDPLVSQIDDLLNRLSVGTATDADLAALQRTLLAANPARAIAAITQFLATGRDAATAREFAIGDGGTLDGSPTLRVLLLDVLGQISKVSGSDAAATVARQTLETKGSADEWAVSLRNVAWHEPAATAFLAGKMREMLGHEPWRAEPSGGMLEAFDVAVFTRDATLLPALAQMRRDGAPTLQRAAAVALDRLAETAPLAVMTRLNANPGELSDRPFLRADYFAKADLSQPAQRSAVEAYLGRADVSAAEKSKLLAALAAPASFVSPTPNLLTPETAPDDPPARQEAVGAATAEWLARGRFPELRPQVEKLRQRLGK